MNMLDQEDLDDFQSVYQCHFLKEIFILYLTGVNKSSSRYDKVPVLHTFMSEKQPYLMCFSSVVLFKKLKILF